MEDKETLHFTIFGLNFTLHKKRYFALVMKVWLIMCVVLLVSVLGFSYEMTSADIPGGFIAGALFAYLLHIIIE